MKNRDDIVAHLARLDDLAEKREDRARRDRQTRWALERELRRHDLRELVNVLTPVFD